MNKITSGTHTRIYSKQSVSGVRAVVRDLIDGAKMRDVWQAFAWDEIQNRYRRSYLGLIWIAVSHLIFVIAIAAFFGGFSNLTSSNFVYHVAIGFAIFQFLIGNISDGCNVFRSSAAWIKSSSLPYSIYLYKSIARSVFPFSIQLTVSFVLIFSLGWQPDIKFLLIFPTFIIFLVNALAIQQILGLIALRWQDITHLVGAITRLMFFITPILWVYEERTGTVRKIATINPLTHYVEVFRAPILGHFPEMQSYFFVLGWTVFLFLASLFIAGRLRRRLPFWV